MMKGRIKNCSNDYIKLEDQSLALEMTKMKIRSFSVPYCVHTKRERINFKLSLEKELEELQAKLDNDPNINTHKLYTLNKNELEQIEKDEVNMQIFKCKVKWPEEGEKNSMYFLSLEKRNFTNKLIKDN